MDKEPDRRPSLDEVRDRLTRVREAAPAPRSRRWIAIAAGTVVVAIAVALVYLPLQRPASPPAPVAVVAPAPAPPVAPAPLRSSVVITADAPNARIVIDGQVIAESAASARTEVEARADGHEVVVSAPGRRPFRTRLKIDPGASAEVSARLELLKAAEHKPARRQRIPEPAVDDDAPLRVFDK